VWDVRVVEGYAEDATRSSRMHKILPHQFLSAYDVSIFIDGNYILTKDIRQLLDEELGDEVMLTFDHNQCSDAWDCVYTELDMLLSIGEKAGTYKDDPAQMKAQIAGYLKEGYPEHNGLIFSACLIRRHNDPKVIQVMEDWWTEVRTKSKRDQLSFNYVAWKNQFKFKVLNGDLRSHEYLFMLAKHGQNFKMKYWKYRFKKCFGLRPKR